MNRKTKTSDKSKFPLVYFADAKVEKLEPARTLPAKFKRMLKKLKLEKRVKGKSVGIKMHFGGNLGFTTIHPLFIRLLVEALKEAGAKSIKAMDNNPETGIPRGYTKEVLGCELVSTFGSSGKYLYEKKIGFGKLNTAFFGGEALDCDFLVDLSHVKGHGACGFGGALKNIAMGVVDRSTRGKLHRLEGGIKYNKKKCTFCKKCFKECPNGAITVDEEKKDIGFFFHNCTYCQHCVMICPQGALLMTERKFKDFSQGMALVTNEFLKNFVPENLLFINILLNITIFCDCWGMSSPAIVPDIGILASDDINAVEYASLDMIKHENLMESGLPKGRKLHESGHLFERIHGKDPYIMLDYLKELRGGAREYTLKTVK